MAMIEESTTVRYGNTSGYVTLATGLESAVRNAGRYGVVGYSVWDNRDGTADVTVSGEAAPVDEVMTWMERAF